MKNQSLVLYSSLILMIWTSCLALKPTYNSGRYTFSKKANKILQNQDSMVIYGFVRSLNKKQVLSPASIVFGCSKISTDRAGYYRLKLETISIKTFLVTNHIGFRTIETEPILLARGDSVNINFYLSEDDRIIFDCQ